MKLTLNPAVILTTPMIINPIPIPHIRLNKIYFINLWKKAYSTESFKNKVPQLKFLSQINNLKLFTERWKFLFLLQNLRS